MRFTRIEIVLNVLFWVFFSWAYLTGEISMDVVGSEIIDGKEKDILVRNYSKTYAIIILQCISILFSYIELYLIHRLTKPKAVRAFVIKSILLSFGFYLIQILFIILFFYLRDEKEILDNSNIFRASAFLNIFYIAVAILYGFTKKWIQHEQDKKQLELVKNQAELNLLKQQLQPHFLFNTLNNLLAMVNQTDNPKLAQGIDKLSGLLRFVVYDAKSERVTIVQEIAFVKNYIELHTLRFEEGEVDFKLNVTGNFDTQKIEPGIFLCYVENAFKHGVQPEKEAFIKIDIDISKATEIYFKIENSIPKHPFRHNKGGYGILSNQERLDLVYPQKHSIRFIKESTYIVELIIQTDD